MFKSNGISVILITCLSPPFKVLFNFFFVLGTVRVYLGTLVLFYEFVLCDKALDSSMQNQCSPMIATVKNWSGSYKNKVRTRKYEKQVEDLANLLTKEDYQQFFNSKLVEEARALLNAAKVSQKYPGTKQFTICRDYIISTLILRNGSRPGAIRNMTLAEFKAGISSEHGNWQVSVKDHKTKYKGPAVLTFTNLEYDECAVYISRLRNGLPGIDESSSSPVFVSWYGKKMSSSLLGDQFASFFQRATEHNLIARRNRNITATLVRKTFVSKVHSEKPGLKRDLANMLCHSEETAAREYFLQEKMKNVANTYEEMVNLMSEGGKDIVTDLEYVYSDELRAQKFLTLSIVKAKYGRLKNCSLTELQVRDKLRYMQHAKNIKDLEANEPTEKATEEANSENVNDAGCGKTITPENHYLENWKDDPDFDPSSEYEETGTSSGRDSRISYSLEEEKLIKKYFTKFITNPAVLVRRKEVSKILCHFKELETLSNKYSQKNIMTKIRAEKRKYMNM